MAKKVLILSSSPRRGGNSDTLCDEFMRGAAESNHEVEKIFLRDKTIHYCTGCSTCSLYQKPCPQKDDAAEIIEKMVDADVIVMDYNPLTPMRADNVNGHLLFGTTGHDVVTTVCNGKVLMKDREVLVCDVDKVMADCRQSAQELADDINGGK